jgi:hypothetical protein
MIVVIYSKSKKKKRGRKRKKKKIPWVPFCFVTSDYFFFEIKAARPQK